MQSVILHLFFKNYTLPFAAQIRGGCAKFR